MPGRKFNGGDYRYGFQGQEKDDEINGEGNSYSAPYWMYDPRIGRRLNIDPVIRPNYSGYAVLGNNPIIYVDKNGDDWFIYYRSNIFGWKSNVSLIWLEGNGAINNPDSPEKIIHLGESLNYIKVKNFLELKYKTEIAASTIMTPIKGYHLYNGYHLDPELEKDGYGSFGKYRKSTSGMHPTVSADYGTNMENVFEANDKLNFSNFYTFVMTSFLKGEGPENIYFGPETEISRSLENSEVVTKALGLYDSGKLKENTWMYIDISEMAIIDILDRAQGTGTVATPEHLIGSAEVKISKGENGSLNIMIWNTTSLGSGTLGAPRLKKPQTNAPQPYTNRSQTFEINITR